MKRILLLTFFIILLTTSMCMAEGVTMDKDGVVWDIVMQEFNPEIAEPTDHTKIKVDNYTPIVIFNKYGDVTYSLGETISRSVASTITESNSYEIAKSMSKSLSINDAISVGNTIELGMKVANAKSDSFSHEITVTEGEKINHKYDSNFPKNTRFVKHFIGTIPEYHVAKYSIKAKRYIKIIDSYIMSHEPGEEASEDMPITHVLVLEDGSKVNLGREAYQQAIFDRKIYHFDGKEYWESGKGDKVVNAKIAIPIIISGTQYIDKNGDLIAEKRSYTNSRGEYFEDIEPVYSSNTRYKYTNDQLYYFAPSDNIEYKYDSDLDCMFYVESIKMKKHYDGGKLSSLKTALGFDNSSTEREKSIIKADNKTTKHTVTNSTNVWASISVSLGIDIDKIASFKRKIKQTYNYAISSTNAESTSNTVTTSTVFRNISNKPKGTCLMKYYFGTAPEKYTIKQIVVKDGKKESIEEELTRHVPIIYCKFEDKHGKEINPYLNNGAPGTPGNGGGNNPPGEQ